ncbi:MAG: GNAT family N-acetyltransferase [Rhodothermales bacterium]
MNSLVENARRTDLERIEALLNAAGLPTAGVAAIIEDFRVVRDEAGRVVAAGVIEWHAEEGREPDGLIRSVVVDPSRRSQGTGTHLIEHLKASTEKDLYLLTESATGFFRGLGFESIDRALAPPALRASEEFRCLCGESAAFMRRLVDSDMRNAP